MYLHINMSHLLEYNGCECVYIKYLLILENMDIKICRSKWSYSNRSFSLVCMSGLYYSTYLSWFLAICSFLVSIWQLLLHWEFGTTKNQYTLIFPNCILPIMCIYCNIVLPCKSTHAEYIYFHKKK